MGGDPTGIRVPGATEIGPAWVDDDRPKPRALLLDALDRLIEVGYIRREDRERAVIACWATVHGLSIMLLDLLPGLDPAQRAEAVDHALDVLIAGLPPHAR
jgi:hypothetical protein